MSFDISHLKKPGGFVGKKGGVVGWGLNNKVPRNRSIVYITMLTFLAFAELNMGLDRGNGRLMLRIRKGLLARTECERPEHYPAG
jgi:hypothetical protein